MNNKAFVLCIGAYLLLISCSSKETKEKNESYQVINPIIADTVYTKEYVAEINALQNVEVRARIKGFIETIFVDEGQIVQKGQILFSISNKGYEQDLLKSKATTKSALADLKLAEIELTNAEKLLEKNVIAKTEYEFAVAKVEVFKAKVQEAQSEEAQANLNLSYAEVRAPFNGVINRIPHKTGSLVEEGTLLTSISNSKEVYAYFNVSEKEYLDLAAEHIAENTADRYIKEAASLILANGETYKYQGIIETSESEFDPATGNLAFRARFLNPEGMLKHGGNGKIVIERPLKNVMIIPQKSTFEIQDKLYVYVLKTDSTVELRNIVSNIRLPHLFIVEEGLKKEEQILYEGVQSVGEGDKIIPKRISPRDLQHFTL
jgi:membrane fusion protein (multidrug efflux system)